MAIATAFVAGICGTLLVQRTTENRPDAAEQAEVRRDLQQADIKIGNLALTALNDGARGTHLVEDGEWGGPTIIIRRAKSEIDVGMNRVDGQLDPNTTQGVSVWLNRGGVSNPRGDEGLEYIFITKDGKDSWQSNAELFVDAQRGEVVSMHVDESNPNVTNSSTVSARAQEMAHQIIDPLLAKK